MLKTREHTQQHPVSEGEDGDGPTRHTPLPVDFRRAGRHRPRPRCMARRQTSDAVRRIRRVLHPPGGLRGDGRGIYQGTFRIQQIRADTSASGADDRRMFTNYKAKYTYVKFCCLLFEIRLVSRICALQ